MEAPMKKRYLPIAAILVLAFAVLPVQAKENSSPSPERTTSPISRPDSSPSPRASRSPSVTPSPTPDERRSTGLGFQEPSPSPQYLMPDDLGFLGYLTNSIVFGLFGFLILLALLLHVVHLLRTSGLNRDIEQLAICQRNLAGRTGAPSGKNPGIDRISDQLNQQGQ